MLDKVNRVNFLYDFYSSLLTEKQRKIFELYYKQDLSLGEIAEEAEISRQAVHDLLRRSENSLEEWESKLYLLDQYQTFQKKLIEMQSLLKEINNLENVNKVKIIINDLLEENFINKKSI